MTMEEARAYAAKYGEQYAPEVSPVGRWIVEHGIPQSETAGPMPAPGELRKAIKAALGKPKGYELT